MTEDEKKAYNAYCSYIHKTAQAAGYKPGTYGIAVTWDQFDPYAKEYWLKESK